jgi:hypothetical protein
MMLGECFGMPPGFAQPVLYETIENAIDRLSIIGRVVVNEQKVVDELAAAQKIDEADVVWDLAAGLHAENEVIVPAYTFPATANAVELCGGRAVLVDVDPDTYSLQPHDWFLSQIGPVRSAVVDGTSKKMLAYDAWNAGLVLAHRQQRPAQRPPSERAEHAG